MGLFGGFRAKFTRNPKEKKNTNEVVCLKYHVTSEFDQPPRQYEGNNNIPVVRKNSVIRKPSVKPRRSILTNGSFVEPKGTPKPHVIQRSRLQSYSSDETITKNNVKSTNSFNYAVKTTSDNEGNVIKRKTSRTKTISTSSNHDDKRNSVNTSRKNSIQKSEKIDIIEVKNNENNIIKTRHVEKSVLLAMTQSSDSDSDDSIPPPLPTSRPPSAAPRSLYSSQISLEKDNLTIASGSEASSSRKDSEPKPIVTFGSDDETASVKSDDDFKITVVSHDKKCLQEEYSEEETENEVEDFDNMGYSSQAANIFFGVGDEFEVSRPRNFKFRDENDDDDRSSVDC